MTGKIWKNCGEVYFVTHCRWKFSSTNSPCRLLVQMRGGAISPILTMGGAHMPSDDESDCDENFNFHFRVKMLPYRAPLLSQIFNCLDELDATITKLAEKFLVQRSASKRVKRRQIGVFLAPPKSLLHFHKTYMAISGWMTTNPHSCT